MTQDSKGRTLLGVCSYTVTAQLNLNDLQYFLFFDSRDVNSRMILPHYGMTAREVTLGQQTLHWVTKSEDGTERLTDLTADEIQQYADLVEAVPPDESAMTEMLDRVQATVILPLAAEGTTVSWLLPQKIRPSQRRRDGFSEVIFKKAKKPLTTGAKSCIMITKEDGNGRSLRFAIKKITVAGGIVGGYLFLLLW